MRSSDWSSDVCSSDLLVGGVEALDHAEDQLPVLLLDADPVVGDLDAPTVAVLHPARGDLEAHRPVGASEPHGVAQQVLYHTDRKRVVEGQSVQVRVGPGRRRISKKKYDSH